MKRTTWVPEMISVGEAADGSGLKSLHFHDRGDTTIVPLGPNDARRIAAGLLGVEIPDAPEIELPAGPLQ